MNELLTPLPPGILQVKPFVPHTLEHLTEKRVFPSPLPELAYGKLLEEYAALDDVTVMDMVYDSGGLKVTGIMALPKAATGKHPILIYNRGGSREYGKLTLLNVLRSMVPFARAGYMVFASNYRGNAGSEGQEEFGGADLADVMHLLDIARAHPAFDGQNAFMLGHSRGGMMTTLAIKAGATLRAGVSIAGIADARKLVHSPGIVKNVYEVIVPGYREAQERVLTARSALAWPEAISVPLLLLHGDNDKDVHHSDSLELQAAIVAAGGVAEVEVYPGGSHALLRHWPQVLERSLGWLERHRA